MKASCSNSVHLNFTLLDLKSITGTNVYARFFSHMSVVIHYTYELMYLFLGSQWLHICIGCIFYLWVLLRSVLPRQPKYSICYFSKEILFINTLQLFSYSVFRVNSNVCTWSVWYPFVDIKSLSIYAQINHSFSVFKCLVNMIFQLLVVFNDTPPKEEWP